MEKIKLIIYIDNGSRSVSVIHPNGYSTATNGYGNFFKNTYISYLWTGINGKNTIKEYEEKYPKTKGKYIYEEWEITDELKKVMDIDITKEIYYTKSKRLFFRKKFLYI